MMELSRVVEVVCDGGADASERWSVGSGYLINARIVLTAGHVVAGAESIWVRFDGLHEFAATTLLTMPNEVDLALIEFTSGPVAEQPTRCATVARDAPGQIGHCRVVGFPQFKELTRDGGRRVRDSIQVDGYIPLAEGLISGFLTLRADLRPRARTGESEWAGMSGAAVFARDVLIGVVTEHHLAEGGGSLTLTPFDRLHLLDAPTRARFWISLGVGGNSELPVLRADESYPSDVHSRSASGSRLALPDQLPDFIGRRAEIDRIVELLSDSQSGPRRPAVVVWGQPGVGKSQLAVQAAHELLAWRTRAFHVDLQGYSSRRLTAENAAVLLLAALSPEQDVPAEPEAQVAACRAALRAGRYVVILDNASNAAQVRPLLPGRGESVVLVTSRSPLATLDAELIQLDLLTKDQSIQLIRLMLRRDSGGPSEDDTDLAELVALCGNLPLAIRVAGAVLRGRPGWTAKYLNRRLRDESRRLGLLQRDDLAVRTVFESGFIELTDVERRLFALLGSIHATRVAPWMAAALLDSEIEDAEELLERLVETQLLLAGGVDLSGGLRYRFHDLVRLFAREKLADLDPQVVSGAELRLLSGYLRLLLAFTHGHALEFNYDVARSVDAPWCPSLSAIPTPTDPMEWLIEERNDIVAEVEHAYAQGHWRFVWGLADILDPIFVLSSHGSQSLRVKNLALDAARASGDVQAELNARFFFIGLLLNESEHEKAIAELKELQNLYQQQGNLLKSAQMNQTLGVVQRDWGQLRVAEESLNRSIADYARANVETSADVVIRGLHAAALHNLAIVYREVGRLGEAERLLIRCLATFEEFDDTIAFGRSLHTRGVLHAYLGHYDRAEALYRRANTLCRAVGDRRWTGMTVLALARLAGRRHQWNEMMVLLDQCADLFSAITDPQGVAQVLRSRGSALRRMGKLDEAGDVLDAAHDALQKVGDRRSHGRTHYSKALLEIDRLNWGQALAEVASADRLFNDDDDGPWRCRVSVTRLRALTQDQKARPCTTDEFDGLRSNLAGFAALAGDGFGAVVDHHGAPAIRNSNVSDPSQVAPTPQCVYVSPVSVCRSAQLGRHSSWPALVWPKGTRSPCCSSRAFPLVTGFQGWGT